MKRSSFFFFSLMIILASACGSPGPAQGRPTENVSAVAAPTEEERATPPPTTGPTATAAGQATPTASPAAAAAPSPTAAASPSLPVPELSEAQETQFLNLVGAVLGLPDAFPAASPADPASEALLEELAGLLLVTRTLQPGFLDVMRASFAGFDATTRPITAYLEQLTPAAQAELAQATIRDYYLSAGEEGAILLNLASHFATASYDRDAGVTQLTIPTTDPRQVRLAEGYQEQITVQARVLNPQTLQEEVATLPVLAARVEEAETLVDNQQILLELPAPILAWTEIRFAPGVFIDDSGDRLFGRFFYTNGPEAADAAVALRPWQPGERGRSLLTPGTYGAPPPQLLPPLPEAALAEAMRSRLADSLARAAEPLAGAEADALLARFDEPALVAFSGRPEFRAALLLAQSTLEGSNLDIVAFMMGQNPTGQPIPWMAMDDPALAEIFENGVPAALGDAAAAIRWGAGGQPVFVVDPNALQGQEPVEVLAAAAVRALVAPQGMTGNLAELVLGHLMESLTWGRLAQRNPELLSLGTPRVQFNNLMLVILLGSQVHDHRGTHVGLLSEQAGEAYNTLPGNQVEAVRSYVDFVRFLYRGQVDAAPATAPGDQTTRELLTYLVGGDSEAIGQMRALDLSGNDDYPDFSQNFIRFLDSHLHYSLTNQEAVALARLLGLEVAGGSN